MSFGINIFFLLLGWLLGLISPLLVDEMKKYLKKKEIKTGILTELKEIKFRLACIVFRINSKYGMLDRELLNWLRPLIKEYEGTYAKKLLETIERLVRLDDEQLKALDEYTKPHTLSAMSFKIFYLPFLDSKISDLSLFDIEFQNKIFEIRAQVNFFNENIDQSKFYYEKTFDSSLSEDNYEIIDHNLKDSYRIISETAQHIIDLIRILNVSNGSLNE